MQTILAIPGSLRKDSFNLQLAQAAGKLLEGKADFKVLDYHDVPLYNQDVEFPAPEGVAAAREAVLAADGIWFFSPEYNHGIPGVLKNLIDWLSRPRGAELPQVLLNKPAALSGISMGMSGTGIMQDQLVTLISFLQMRVMNSPRLTIPNSLDLVEGGKLNLEGSTRYIQREADAFLTFIG